MNKLVLILVTTASVCFAAVSLQDIQYNVKSNGIVISLDFSAPIHENRIIGWKSDKGTFYLSLSNVARSKDKISDSIFQEPLEQIVINEFPENLQLAFHLNCHIQGYKIINSHSLSRATIIINTGNYSYSEASLNRSGSNSAISTFHLMENVGFLNYTGKFKEAFDMARDELGINAIFRYGDRLYTTNHPTDKISNMKSVLFTKQVSSEFPKKFKGFTDSFAVLEDNIPKNPDHNLMGNDGDPMDNPEDNQSLTFHLINLTQYGAVMISKNGDVRYTPNLDHNDNVSSDSFTYRIQDNGTTNGENDYLFSDVVTVDINITPVNDEPVLMEIGDHIISEDDYLEVDILADDVDVVTDGQTLAFSVEANSNESLVEVTAVSGDSTGSGKLNFNVQPDQHGVATILVMVTDSQGATDLESTTLTVTEVNDQPIANVDPLMVFENDIPDNSNHNFMGDEEDSVDNFDYQIDTLQLADIASNWDKISRLENNPIWTSSDKMVTMDTSGGEFLLPLEETKPPKSNYQSMKYGIDPEFHLHYSAEIRVKTNLGGIPIYLDGKYLGETPIKDLIQVEPGWHQVSGFSPVFIQSAAADEFLNGVYDPVVQNNKLIGSRTVFAESGKVALAELKFNRVNESSNQWIRETSANWLVRFPMVAMMFGLVTWGLI